MLHGPLVCDRDYMAEKEENNFLYKGCVKKWIFLSKNDTILFQQHRKNQMQMEQNIENKTIKY